MVNEVVDEMCKSKKELLLFKVDFEKTHDLDNWEYLSALMDKMQFPVLWRKWIMECISTARVSMIVNKHYANFDI